MIAMGTLANRYREKAEIAEKLQEYAQKYPEVFLEVAQSLLGVESPKKGAGRDTVWPEIVRYLQENGPSVGSEVIMGVLESGVSSTSSNLRSTIHSTLSARKAKGDLIGEKNEEGRWVYRLPE